ncbi:MULTISPECIES: autotransporter outer membrane beta-barrel domain-containing protein [unclassified Synechococcus]|uniref:autotransporter outer membrane beta-barrel domain-containing protein n=1 Tax=unclassified Synechococcus TaxID=2626047 RepID=UPI001C238574|nr:MULTISPECIES: autotransporter outer membrane beta-barrel domain-containing protein [unclassified Synechococcus]
MVAIGPARAAICPDGTEAEFCLPPVTPLTPPTPPTPPTPTPSPSTPATPASVVPIRPVRVDVYRLDARLLPLGAGMGWRSFSRDLLEPLPQKVRESSPLADPEPEGPSTSAFRFSVQPGGYFSDRDGWRLRVFGNGFGGPLISGVAGGPSSVSGAQMGLRLDYAIGDLLIGAFGRFGSLQAQGGSVNDFGVPFNGQSANGSLGGGGVLVQFAKPGWFIGAALGGDALTTDQPFGISSSNAIGARYSKSSVGGSAFNLATSFGGRIRLSDRQVLEPSALLTLTSLSLGGATVFDGFTNRFWSVPGSSSTVGTADIGITWRAPLHQGRNLLTPSVRLSWLGAGFLGQAPANAVTDGISLATTLPAGSLTQTSGLGLQGGLAYTLRDNTTFYIRGGAGFYGAGTAWDVGGGVEFRWGGAPRATAAKASGADPSTSNP